MASAQRRFSSRALKTAVCGSVLGLVGAVMVPSAKASLVTLELVPTSIASGTGTITGQNVVMAGPGTINFNIVTVIHGSNGSAADDGTEQFGLSILSDSGGALGLLTAAVQSPFNAATAQNGTPTGTPVGTDIGPDRPASTNNLTTQIFWAQSQSASPVLGTAATTGDFAQVIGTGTYTVDGTLGSTTVDPLPHIDSRSTALGRTIEVEVDGTVYSLNGNGTGIVLSGPGTIPAGAIDTVGGSINVTVAPEPASIGLAGLGGLGMLLRRRRR